MRPGGNACPLALALLAAGCAPPPPARPVDPPPAEPPAPASIELPVAAPPPVEPPAAAPPGPTPPPTPAASAGGPQREPRTSGLDPAVIQSIIRASFGSLRRCYEEHLRCCPNLQNRVTVRFVIGRDGRVQSARDAGSDLPDGETVACVVRAMAKLSFPPPKGGPLTVTYPVMFSPSP